MVSTRNAKQQKLTVSKESSDDNKVQVAQDDKKRERGEDDGGDNGKGAESDSHSQPPPAKAAKVEEGQGKDGREGEHKEVSSNENEDEGAEGEGGAESKGNGNNGKGDHANGDTDAAVTATSSSKTEQKVSGKDTNESSTKWTILERGHVYFFYRPKVQSAEDESREQPAADSLSSVQNFHLLMLPRASDSPTAPAKDSSTTQSSSGQATQTGEKALTSGIGARLLRLGKKRMPEPSVALSNGDEPGGIGGDSSESLWAVISDVGTTFEELKDGFRKREYSTKTSGQRVVQGSRIVGRGWYVLSESLIEPPSSREVRLSYVLSHPSEMGDVQKELGLAGESSVQLQMRNPTLPSTGQGAPPAGLDPASRVELSRDELEKTFGGDSEEGTRYARPENVALLDRAGVELLMIKRKSEDVLGLGETQKEAVEKLASEEGERLDSQDVIRKELHLDALENPPDALDGEWI